MYTDSPDRFDHRHCEAETVADMKSAFERFVAGDTTAFDGVVVSYSGPAYAVALRVLGDQQQAEDAVQDAMVRIWKVAARSFDPARGHERSWILTVVRNVAVDALRRRKDGERSIDESLFVYDTRDDSSTWQAVLQRLTRAEVQEALRRIPAEQREVLTLAYYGGIRPVEIARRLGVPEGTVRSRLRLALKRLRSDLAGGEVGGHA
jgi:RNA polymerase sigma-70 factor, ECF subfamily